MKLISLTQNTQKWLEFRRSHVGASDIGIIMEGSENEVSALLESKLLGKEKFQNEAMKRGHELEGVARSWFNQTYKFDFIPTVAVHDEHEWLMASFDGYDDMRRSLLEIKCPKEALLEDHPMFKKWWWQVQAQMSVTGLDEAFLFAYGEEFRLCINVKRDDKAIVRLIKNGKEFMDRLTSGELPKDTLPLVEDEDTQNLANQVHLIHKLIKNLEEEYKLSKQRLIDKGRGESFRCGVTVVKKIERKGLVDYKKVPELKGIDLEPYRKPSIYYWDIDVSCSDVDGSLAF